MCVSGCAMLEVLATCCYGLVLGATLPCCPGPPVRCGPMPSSRGAPQESPHNMST